ncbi:MAG: NUDIX domain-containing protein [Dehalococcoidia bacterium]|jgi:8-oxo-dGTP pyrophosphatase MutT (NUDIX family)
MTNKPKFNNTPNEHVVLIQESTIKRTVLDYWISRAVAVVGVVFSNPFDGGMQVLTVKRSAEMRDEAGKWGLPCGYLDWNENGYEGMVREVYEETSLYLPNYQKYLINNNEKPFTVHDSPNRDARQNVSLIYLSVYDFHNETVEFPLYIEKYTDKETAEVKWMPMLDFFGKYEREYEWSFRHNETIREALEFFNRNFERVKPK